MSSNSEPALKYEAEYSLKPFFELSHDLLCIAGFDGYFKKINPALCTLLGYTEVELLSRPINDFIHPNDKEETSKHRDLIRDGNPLLNYENRYIAKSGEIVWLSWTSIPVKEDSLVYAIAKNATLKKTQEHRRNRLITELSKSNDRLKQLNYTTSHDLRSPVFNLMSVFSLLDTSTIEDPETLEFIRVLETATQNLKDSLDRYLDSLHRDKTLKVNTEELDISNIFNSVIESLDAMIRDANACIEIDLQNFETIIFNRDYLESIFMNLVTNSIKYAHPERNPIISLKTRSQQGSRQLLFSDNGRGFDSDAHSSSIFKLNQTFHDHKDSKGIGLYLVNNYVNSMGGTISVESEVGVGTTFIISLGT